MRNTLTTDKELVELLYQTKPFSTIKEAWYHYCSDEIINMPYGLTPEKLVRETVNLVIEGRLMFIGLKGDRDEGLNAENRYFFKD